jgi:isopentenyldiphosphate isomerase
VIPSDRPHTPVGLELVDIVDETDTVIRTATRAEMRAGRLLHRAVFIGVLHPDGRLLIHQRSHAKDLWPGRWDLAVGGVVGSGEGYDAAAVRELAEEIGISDTRPVAIGGGAFHDESVELIGRCYTVVTAGPFRFADGEVIHAEWVDPTDLAALIRQRDFLPDSIAVLLPLLFSR